MTDHLPSKDKLLIELRGWHTLKGADCFRQAADEIETLRRKLNECGLECSATMKSLVADNERLRTALTGISTCSTCEACRGAALRALGERSVAEINAAVASEPPAEVRQCKRHSWFVAGYSQKGPYMYERLRCRWCPAFKNRRLRA